MIIAAMVGSGAWAHTARAAGGTGGGGCGAGGYPAGYGVWCQSGTASPGSTGASGAGNGPAAPAPGGGGGPAYTPCAFFPIAGDATHMIQVCPPGQSSGHNGIVYGATTTVVPVGGNAGGPAAAAPQVTPQQLLQWARSKLSLPLPGIRTAPPRGSEGLVGLPEWFWVDPGQWHPVTARVAVGAVWAQVTARPARITIRPGTGATVTCPGPGTPYNPGLPAQAQHSDCTFTYGQSSDGLPGNAYQASATVTWDASWQGSGGAGGALGPAGQTAAFPVPVAEAQSLNQAGS
jgi:hypothetical protein